MPLRRGVLDAWAQPMDRCQRCSRALDRVYLIIAGRNHCTWCLHPILRQQAFAAAKALVLMESRHVLIRTLIDDEDARTRAHQEPT